MPTPACSPVKHMLFTLVGIMALLTASCSIPAAPVASENWYEGVLYENEPFYVTKTAMSWESTRPNADFGHWTAVSTYDPSGWMKAEGRRFTIGPGYGWDGVTWGPSTPRMISPSLFHDAMLHAMMNGAPISRKQIDQAFYDIMRARHASCRHLYYPFVRLFGWCFTFPQHPRTLKINKHQGKHGS